MDILIQEKHIDYIHIVEIKQPKNKRTNCFNIRLYPHSGNKTQEILTLQKDLSKDYIHIVEIKLHYNSFWSIIFNRLYPHSGNKTRL